MNEIGRKTQLGSENADSFKKTSLAIRQNVRMTHLDGSFYFEGDDGAWNKRSNILLLAECFLDILNYSEHPVDYVSYIA